MPLKGTKKRRYYKKYYMYNKERISEKSRLIMKTWRKVVLIV